MLWISEQVPGTRCTHLKDLSNGVIWCRLMTKLWPGSLASVLVINRPANCNDSQHNYILLESAFAKVNMRWMFETDKLIAGDSAELIRLAHAMVNVDSVFKRQLKVQRKLKQAPAKKSSRSTRIPAGNMLPERGSTLKATSSQNHQNVPPSSPSSAAPAPPLSELLQLSTSPGSPGLTMDAVETAEGLQQASHSMSTLNEAQRMRQEIRNMFHQQQLAMEDYMAQQRQLVSSAAGHAYAAMCLCPKCVQQRQNPPVASETAVDETTRLAEAEAAEVRPEAPEAHASPEVPK